jgi:hypothetical protein
MLVIIGLIVLLAAAVAGVAAARQSVLGEHAG